MTNLIRIVYLLFFFIFPPTSQSSPEQVKSVQYQVHISMDERIHNPGQRCSWSCLETLARKHHIEQLYNASKKDKEFPIVSVHDIEKILNKLKVKCLVQKPGNYDKKIFEKGCRDQKLGVAFCISYTRKGVHWCHMILAVHYNERGIWFIDPNDINSIKFASNDWLEKYWDGSAILLYPPRSIK